MSEPVQRDRDVEKVIDERQGNRFERRIVGRDLRGDLEHVLTEERHPGRGVSLLEMPASGQRRRLVEHTDIVETKETTLEDVLPEAVLPVDPPVEIRNQLVERSLQERKVS